MKLLTFLIALTAVGRLFAADKPTPGGDPFAGAFFPPDVVLMARDQIGLTPEQLRAIQGRVEKVQQRSEELRAKLERESTAMVALVKQDQVDEAALSAQLDKVLDAEREVKHLHVGLVAGIKNLLTAEQRAKLREITKGGGAQLGEEARKRLTEKMEQVKEGAQKMAAGGRDPSDILRAMEEKFKPLVEGGKIVEAEAELDRVLEQLKADAK